MSGERERERGGRGRAKASSLSHLIGQCWRYFSDERNDDVTADPRMRESVKAGMSLEAAAARARMKTVRDQLLSAQPRRW